MLIRILKKSKDLLEGKPHEAHSEISRRSFMQKGATGVGSLLILPSFLTLLKSDPAKAAAFSCSFAANGTTYTQLAASGGNGTTRMAYAWGMDGNALVGDSRALGTRPNDPVDSTTIPGIYLNGNDTFARTLKAGGAINANGVNSAAMFNAAITNEILSKLSGSQIACPKNDDTNENPVNVMALFGTKCALRKGMISDVAGDAANDRSIDGMRNNFAVLRYGGNTTNLVNGASLQSNSINDARIGESMRKAAAKLTDIQKGSIAGRVGSIDFSANLLAGLEDGKTKFDPVTADIALNPANPVNAAIFASRAPANALSDKDKGYQALIDAACKQNFGAVNIVEGGFDYHNGGNNDANNRHAYLARFILLWGWVHVCRGTNGVLQIDTDGGIGWDQSNAPNAMGDRGSSSQSLFFHVAGRAGTRPSFKRQGYYSDLIANGGGESSSRDPLVGKRPEMASIACLLTYGLLTGTLKSTDNSLVEFLAAINAKGTIIPGGVSQLMQLSMIA
ncbi:MAG: hypothetical protein H7301_08305 [Cryobacterium sp.]|nr:hypothetical protein [Oligoflexia bacterium]